jgi:hypothetical protein
MAKGYVYVLTNQSMDGLIKVGKTIKDPKERARELSSATGVPTPYQVIYYEEFFDCGLAEQMIHKGLEEKGYRVNQNREFFNAETREIINLINQIKNLFNTEEFIKEHDNDSDLFEEDEAQTYAQRIENIESQGDCYFYGLGKFLQDYREAYKYYLEAYNMGSPTAPAKIGNIFKNGEGFRQDYARALDFYKEGVVRGNNKSWYGIACIYAEKSHIDNFMKAFKNYILANDEDEKDEAFDFNLKELLLKLINLPIENQDKVKLIEAIENTLSTIDSKTKTLITFFTNNYNMFSFHAMNTIAILYEQIGMYAIALEYYMNNIKCLSSKINSGEYNNIDEKVFAEFMYKIAHKCIQWFDEKKIKDKDLTMFSNTIVISHSILIGYCENLIAQAEKTARLTRLDWQRDAKNNEIKEYQKIILLINLSKENMDYDILLGRMDKRFK